MLDMEIEPTDQSNSILEHTEAILAAEAPEAVDPKPTKKPLSED